MLKRKLQITLAGAIFFLLGSTLNRSSWTWAENPKNYQLPAAEYKTYALSTTLDSLDSGSKENRRRTRNGFGYVPKVMGSGEGYAQISSSAIEALLNIPLGWEALDDGKKLRVFTPDNDILLVLNWVSFEKYGTFDQFKNKFFEQSIHDFKERKQTNKTMKVELLALPSGVFGHKLLNVQDELEMFSLFTAFIPQPQKAGYALRVNLSAPPEKLDQYLGLIGLILRDVKVNGVSSTGIATQGSPAESNP
jgi:hypothetical protein